MTDEQIARAQRLWQQGISTVSIAAICRVPENEVYNRIDQIKKIQPLPRAKKI